jgi:hypothetical protein
VYSNIETENAKTVKRTAGDKPPADAVLKWRGKVPLGVNAPADTAAATPPTTEPDEKDPFKRLITAQQTWNDSSLSRNNSTVRTSLETESKAAQGWLDSKIKQLNDEIKELERHLGSAADSSNLVKVVNEEGVTITDEDRKANPRMSQSLSLPFHASNTDMWFRTCWKTSSRRSEQMD